MRSWTEFHRLTFILLCHLWAPVIAQAQTADPNYTITNTMEMLPPYDLGAMNTPFQQAELINKTADNTAIIRFTYKPYTTLKPLVPNSNWFFDNQKDPSLQMYLKPGITANWDLEFRQKLLADLKQSGIDPTNLNDMEVVQRVSVWLDQSFHRPSPFIAFLVKFENGKPIVPSELRSAFDQAKKDAKIQTDEDAFARAIYGKGIYENRSASSCTPSAILWTTVFRALGIPTRIISNFPAVDANDPQQIRSAEMSIRDLDIQRKSFFGFQRVAPKFIEGFNNHTFNEVFVGGRWARLNYRVLDQPIVDSNYFGIMTQIFRVKDWSEVDVTQTWGRRYSILTQAINDAQTKGLTPNQFKALNFSPQLSSVNPYRSTSIQDNLSGPSLPVVSAPGTAEQAWLQGNPSVPAWIAPILNNSPGITKVAITLKDLAQNNDFGAFSGGFAKFSSPHLVLKIPNHSPVVGTQFDGSFYFTSDHPYGLVVSFPVDSSELIEGTTIDVPADNPKNYPWIFNGPIKLSVPPIKTATLISAQLADQNMMKCPLDKVCIVLGLLESYQNEDPASIASLFQPMAGNFSLISLGQSEVPMKYYGSTALNNGSVIGLVWTVDSALIQPGISYQVKNTGTPAAGGFKCVFPKVLTISR